MNLEEVLKQRSEQKCELCKSADNVKLYEVFHDSQHNADNCIMICSVCQNQIDKKAELDSAHWHCLSESMWSEVPGVQVTSWRMLNRLRNESWAADLLEMLYLNDELLAWAKSTGDHENDGTVELHRDSNGHQLFDEDNVVLTKSLDVKGSTLNAKMGTVVRNIRLVKDNAEQIEGRVEGQMIVILTKYVRRQNS
jgi:protein PhnA